MNYLKLNIGGLISKYLNPSKPLKLQYPNNEFYYYNGQTKKRDYIKGKKLEGTQLPKGSVIEQAFNIPSGIDLENDQRPVSRRIIYGATPSQNDTVYRIPAHRGYETYNPNLTLKELFNSLYYK